MDTRHQDIAGQKFHLLTAISRHSQRAASRAWVWECKCDCGNTTYVDIGQLRQGSVKSCGCHRIANAREQHTKHGQAHSPTYNSWKSMKARCLNPNAPDYPEYGGRGIIVCARWINSFEAFLEDMGERPKGKSLDREDNMGNYTPSNCIWSTPKEQANNRRAPRTRRKAGEQSTVAELTA